MPPKTFTIPDPTLTEDRFNPLRKIFFFLSGIFFLLLAGPLLYAQEYPVQVTTILTPPYSLYLSDYASPEGNAMQVIIRLRELDRPAYRVKLRLTIEGQGITLRTRPTYLPPALVLQGGVPEILTGPDLRGYLDPDNLDFSGISKQEFIKKGTFPEGFYTFRIEVLDYVRNVVVSNAGLSNAWIMLNDPPIINIPFNDEKVVATDPQNIMFSWTPRHTASPNAAFSTEYEFRLVELYPADRNPEDAVRASNSIFVTHTSSTSLNYGVMEPLLVPGRKYAFRVRAYDMSGRDLFKNNGYSETHVFQFGDACTHPVKIEAAALDNTRIKLTWDGLDIHTGYGYRYRRKGSTEWTEENTVSNSAIIPGLQPGSTYEYQVKGVCGTLTGALSPVATMETPVADDDAFVCGAEAPVFELSTNPYKGALGPGDVIRTADFEITLEDITANADGTYKGTGFAQVPWLKFASMKVKFYNIGINEDLRVYKGNISTVYSESSRFNVELDLVKDKMAEGQTAEDTTTHDLIGFDGVDLPPLDDDIAAVSVDTTGHIIVETEEGEVITLDRPKDPQDEDQYEDTRVTDENGDTWIVDKDGDVRKGADTTAPTPVASPDTIDFTVKFVKNENQRYGFDAKIYNAGTYENEQIRDEEYWIAWKSVEMGTQDIVNATAEGKTAFPGVVGFETGRGEVPSQQGMNNAEKQVFVTGPVADETESLTAYVPVKQEGEKEPVKVTVGKLNVKAYNKRIEHVYLVPVNDAGENLPDINTIATKLNAIYRQAVAEWMVTLDPVFTIDPDFIEGIDADQASMFSSFNTKMKAFNRAFKRERGIDKDGYYVFIMEGSGASRAGIMPFKRQFGYIFADNATDIVTTIAHELGHGAFRLRHTFSTEAFVASEGTTDNLMDYTGGTSLKKYQWDNVHDQKNVISWLEDEGESAMISLPCVGLFDDCDDVKKKLEAIKEAYSKSQKITGRIPYSAANKVLNGYNLKIENTDYNLISIHFTGSSDLQYTIDPKLYIDYDEQITSAFGGTMHQRGIAFKDDQQVVMKILLTEDTDEDFLKKKEDLKKYLFGEDIIYPTFEINQDDIDEVTMQCTEWSNDNNVSYTCNFCVRDAFYKITGSTILYPKSPNNICNCCDPQENNLEGGLVEGSGTANTIYNTLADQDSNLAQYFEEIKDIEGEDYPDFMQMQEDTENGQMIIGVLKRSGPGHVVLLMPESLWNEIGNRDEIPLNNGEIMDEPLALECGNATDKRIKPLSGFGQVDDDNFKNVKWYKYIGQ